MITTADVMMATKFTISDSESEPSEEVEESETDQSWNEQNILLNHSLNLPLSNLTASGRVRLNSESHATARDTKLQIKGEGEDGLAGDGTPFRGRSQSAPAALWAAKKYGRQLRRMSDEFDSWLDKGEIKRVRNAGPARQIQHSKSWWNYLFSHQESDGENNHHENHSKRTE